MTHKVSEPIWVLCSIIDTVHDMQLVEHGGATGLRNEGLLISCLMRPRNLYAYGVSDLYALAAAYAFGIIRNHPFIDGNKRTAFLTAYIFLRLNGLNLQADEISATHAVLSFADDTMSEEEFAGWLRENTNRLKA